MKRASVDIRTRIAFTFADDIEEPKSVIFLRPLSRVEFLGFQKYVVDGKMVLAGEALTELMTKAIVGVKDYQVGDATVTGDDLPARLLAINGFSTEDITAIITKISEMNNLGKVEQKN